jgi:hypothetical protein
MENRDAAIAAIRTCKTRGDLDEMLTKFEIPDGEETIKCLDECMYSPQKFFATSMSLDTDVEFTKQIFITGAWRINEVYERMGIPMQRPQEVSHAV